MYIAIITGNRKNIMHVRVPADRRSEIQGRSHICRKWVIGIDVL